MAVSQAIEARIREALAPQHLEIINESHKHNVPPGSESHFKVIVVSDDFDGQPRIQRHRRLNALLAPEIAAGIHALSLETLTAAEWAAREGRRRESPPCLGGGRKTAEG